MFTQVTQSHRSLELTDSPHFTSQALPLLKAAYDRGLNTWDTANVYSNGVSEEIVGKAIKKYNIPREKVVILTKCFWAVGEDPGKQLCSVLPRFHPFLTHQ